MLLPRYPWRREGRNAGQPDEFKNDSGNVRVRTLLQAEELSVLYAERTVLDRISLTVRTGERLALLGRNGAGKTTLLRLLSGERRPDEGHVWREDGLQLAVLAQQPLFEAGQTVAELLRAADPFLAARDELEALLVRLDEAEAMERWMTLQRRFEDDGGYGWQSRAARIFGMLDLSRFLEREADTLSGGEGTRLSLALALAQEPDLLLLDEPTNHLDIRMREWLEGYLLAFAGGLILTSHDRDFLDTVATRSLWLEGGEAAEYPGGYSRARSLRELERRTQGRAHRLGTREEQRLVASADQLDLWGRRSKAVKSRLSRTAVAEAPASERRLKMRLLAGQARARLLLWGEHLSKSYGEKAVLSGVALKIRQGDRIALMGANGTGKTSLLRLLAGDDQPDPMTPEGPPVLRLAPGVQVVTLDQTWHGLDSSEGLYAQFDERFGARAAALLGRAGFGQADWLKTPAELSGGERARAGLALVSALRADLLLLDEPTNHLDLATREALSMALNEFEGTVMLVSHDRALLRAVCDEFWMVSQGGVSPFDGDLDDYQKYLLDHAKRMREEAKKSSQAPSSSSAQSKPNATKSVATTAYKQDVLNTFESKKLVKKAPQGTPDQRKSDAKTRQQQSDATRPLRKELEKLDGQLQALNAEKDSLQNTLASTTPATIATIGKRLKTIDAEIGTLEERWLELTEQIETAAV